jgi:acyl-coenzyme A thioesterase PaaI-like protein
LTSEVTRGPAVGVAPGPGVPEFELSPHNCFACGTLNTHGLRMLLHVEPGRSWSEVTLEPRFEGWAGIAHGGILCTVLDEVMAWALVGDDNWGLTAKLSVDFRKPVEIGRPFVAEGWVTRTRRRLIYTAGRLVDAESRLELAAAEGVYLAAGEARKQELRARYGFRIAGGSEIDTAGSVAPVRVARERTP